MRRATKYVPDYTFIDFVCDQSFFCTDVFWIGACFLALVRAFRRWHRGVVRVFRELAA